VLVREDVRAVEGLDVERVRGDVLDPESLRRAFDGAEVVYHLAARISVTGDPDGSVWRTNVDGPRNVAEACLACRVRRLVHFSSVHALAQDPVDVPLDESRAPADRPGDLAYDRSKAAGGRAVREALARGLDAVIVHPSAILGPIDWKPSAMGQVLLDLHHRRLPALVAGGFDWVDVRDVVAGALAAEAQARTGERYILSGAWLTVRDLAALAAGVTGVPRPRLTAPMWLARVGAPFAQAWAGLRGTRPLFTSDSLHALRANRCMSHDKAARDLGYSPRPLRETVADAYAWFREHGMLGKEPGRGP
jgi:dihydroflavonol-4-reductase